jgi:hypothetical protein
MFVQTRTILLYALRNRVFKLSKKHRDELLHMVQYAINTVELNAIADRAKELENL